MDLPGEILENIQRILWRIYRKESEIIFRILWEPSHSKLQMECYNNILDFLGKSSYDFIVECSEKFPGRIAGQICGGLRNTYNIWSNEGRISREDLSRVVCNSRFFLSNCTKPRTQFLGNPLRSFRRNFRMSFSKSKFLWLLVKVKKKLLKRTLFLHSSEKFMEGFGWISGGILTTFLKNL